MTLYEQALVVTADPTERLDLLTRAGEAARRGGNPLRAEEQLRTALTLAKELDDGASGARITGYIGQVLTMMFRTQEAVDLLEPGLVEYSDVDEDVLAELRFHLGRALVFNRDTRRALEVLETALETAERHQLREVIAAGLAARAVALSSIGRRQESAALLTAAAQRAAEWGLTELQIRALGNLAISFADFDQIACYEAMLEGIQLSRRHGLRDLLMNGIGNMGYQAWSVADWDAGMAMMGEALEDDPSPRAHMLILSNYLVIKIYRGEPIDDGLATMRRLGSDMSSQFADGFVDDLLAHHGMVSGNFAKAHDIFAAQAANDETYASESLYRAARASLWSGDATEAKRLEALSEESGTSGPTHEGRHAAIKAAIAAVENRPTEALGLYRQALAKLQESNSVWDVALLGLDMAQFLDPADPEVAAAVAASREIMERVGAAATLRLLDAAVTRTAAQPQETALSAQASAEVGVVSS